jgi:CheY-like chemotaxis protein
MSAETVEQRGARVLIVEDHQSQRRVLADILRDHGYEPVACASAEEALQRLEFEDFAVAIVDQRLPDLEGTRLLERMQQLSPGIRAIINTAYGSFESARDAVNLGAFAYLEKVRDSHELIRHVDRAVQELMGEALLGSAVRLRTILENAPDTIVQTDRSGSILFANRALPGQAGEAVGGNLLDLFPAESRTAVQEQLARLFESGRPVRYAVAGLDPAAAATQYDCRAAPVFASGRVVSVIHSVRPRNDS